MAEFAYSADALVAAHTAFRDLLDAEVGAATVAIRDVANVLLGTVTLQTPCGTVDPVTGQLTLLVDVREESAPATGDIDYVEVRNGTGGVHLTIPAAYGREPVSGFAVFNTLFVDIGKPIEIESIVIG